MSGTWPKVATEVIVPAVAVAPAVVAPQPAVRTFLWRSRAWIALTVLLPTAALAIFATPTERSRTEELGWMVGGWLLFCGGAAFRWWGALYISGRKDNRVVSHGPYSVIRHPLYFGTFLITLSAALFLASWLMVLAVAVAATVYLGITLTREESRLLQIHGEAYRSYMQRVPRFWPNWGLYYSPRKLEIRLTGLGAELRRAARWIWVPFLALLIARLRMESWWPTWGAPW